MSEKWKVMLANILSFQSNSVSSLYLAGGRNRKMNVRWFLIYPFDINREQLWLHSGSQRSRFRWLHSGIGHSALLGFERKPLLRVWARLTPSAETARPCWTAVIEDTQHRVAGLSPRHGTRNDDGDLKSTAEGRGSSPLNLPNGSPILLHRLRNHQQTFSWIGKPSIFF